MTRAWTTLAALGGATLVVVAGGVGFADLGAASRGGGGAGGGGGGAGAAFAPVSIDALVAAATKGA